MKNTPLAPLTDFAQFVTVKLVPLPDGKTDKLPCSPSGQVGVNAHDPANWQTYDRAATLAALLGPGYTVGFTITERDPFWCLDIDGCAQADGTWSPLALELMQSLPGTAVEVSQSGKGLHIWGRGPVPAHAKKNVALHLELYTELRFIALGTHQTGQMAALCPQIADVAARYFPPRAAAVPGSVPDTGPRADWRGPADDNELMARAFASKSAASVFGARASVLDLWTANAGVLARCYPADGAGDFDHSSADAALAQHLAFWTGCDVARIERLMRQSELRRDKWDDRDDYLVERTIRGACARQKDVYQAPVAATPALPAPAAAAAPAPVSAEVVKKATLSLAAASHTNGKPTLHALREALEELDIEVMHDEFAGRDMIQCPNDQAPRPIEHVDPILLRELMETRGFNSIKGELMKDVLAAVAHANRYDSAIEWLKTLTWDGVPRIDTFCPRYWGTADTPYTRAMGPYVWTALAGRAWVPGTKADMVPVLVGEQGAGKSTSIKLLAPNPDYFAEIDLGRDETDLARQMRGKLVCELPELRGMAGKDARVLKSFVARQFEEWVPKYREQTVRVPRRALLFGTTNERAILADDTGERRWLPVEVRALDIEALKNDLLQLWAEALVRFQANGVEGAVVERLARGVHEDYKVDDPIADALVAWLYKPENVGRTIPVSEIFLNVYARPHVTAKDFESRALAAKLRMLGWESVKTVRVENRVMRAWRRRAVS